MTITLNGAQRDVADGMTVAEAVSLLTAATTGCAVAINEEVVPRADWTARRLAGGDRVEILTAVQGG